MALDTELHDYQVLCCEVRRYLAAVQDLYPSGLPRSKAPVEHADEFAWWCSPGAKVAFVGTWDLPSGATAGLLHGPEGELLARAIGKGMGLDLQAVALLWATEEDIARAQSVDAQAMQLRQAVAKRLESSSVVAVVILGEVMRKILLDEVSADSGGLGVWKEFAAKPVITTHGLQTILHEREVKLEFWQHLQLVMSKVGIER
jgi:hypothetical protein